MLAVPSEVELALLRRLEAELREALAAHLRDGDYVSLGIAAQDSVLKLDRSLGRRYT